MADEVTRDMVNVGFMTAAGHLSRDDVKKVYLAMRAVAPRSEAEQMGEDIAWLDAVSCVGSWGVTDSSVRGTSWEAWTDGPEISVKGYPTRAAAIHALRVAVEGGE